MENLGAKWTLSMMKIMWEEVGTALAFTAS